MTLIPLMSVPLMPRAATPPAMASSTLTRGSYNPGAGHRPVAATLAIGLPLALVVAVALSPMIAEVLPPSDPTEVISIRVEPLPPPPPPKPVEKALPPPPSFVDVPLKPVVPVELSENRADPPPVEYVGPPAQIDTGPPTGVLNPPAAKPKFIDALVDPRYAHAFQPDYPASEQRGGVEGIAKVRVLIGADGRVKAIEDAGSSSQGFFAETRRQALRSWRFKPATRGGVAEESWKVMTVRFQIKGG